ncbi:hypothetical protein C3432_07790 [Citrobacter amalonaticus]|uniref:Uncharacterized protein n=1 Tax=Citrobacter amalonaticus TaxID=35703 RepID=A0A2S4RY63_CITAM|nr:hypothetical protein [Citrobacter amalonaticus]POT57835.1 hypothetical protein C3432_07790 [Citrobacter amalonaticus]POT76638.1 hypothetical protein C3436_04035 [Citrobacter amalonaticus]POU65717.1 hypothetical protein C3430_10450 [Citrobacter amalonaticus]POV05874.1 hypothetical protein C3424_11335 [Citrobacter amalonaticus]
MDTLFAYRLSMELVAADIISEYIPLRPVLDNRNELVQERIHIYNSLISDNLDSWRAMGNARSYCQRQVDELIEHAILLVRADIASNFIGHSPVLCERDTMIAESVSKYIKLIDLPMVTPVPVVQTETISYQVDKPKMSVKKKNKRFPRKGKK